MKLIDDFLNSITMYRLVLYLLIIYLAFASILCFLGIWNLSGVGIIVSSIIFGLVCWISNKIFSLIFSVQYNVESNLITALILASIVTPITRLEDLWKMILIGILAMGLKYLLAPLRKHIFNPAALAVFVTGLLIQDGASWWIGASVMTPVLVIGAFLILRKIKRFLLFSSFFVSWLILSGTGAFSFDAISVILFFGSVMLVEPQTTPLNLKWQIMYGVLVGLVSVKLPFESALLIGNSFSFLTGPKKRLILTLREKNKLATGIYELVFNSEKFNFNAGQFLEWTLGYPNTDTRGNRRFFTIASSPTENTVKIGVRFSEKGSSFKKALFNLEKGGEITAGQLSGDFVLPENGKKLVWIAGGIGITPFRSVAKFIIDTKQKRDVILFYSCKTADEFVYKNIFDQAEKIGVKTIYVNTDKMGYINEEMIKKAAPDFKERIFYISGPHSMVDVFKNTLSQMGINKIKVDFFPGYA